MAAKRFQIMVFAALAVLVRPMPAWPGEEILPAWLADTGKALCAVLAGPGRPEAEALARAAGVAQAAVQINRTGPGRFRIQIERDGVTLELLPSSGALASRRVLLSAYSGQGPDTARLDLFYVRMGPDCMPEMARALDYDAKGVPQSLYHYSGNALQQTDAEILNPPVPPGRDPGGVLVAHIDSGVNYLLPGIQERLARDDEGALVGADFYDHDARPFDLDPARSPLSPLRHGTAVASIMLREAPAIRIAPFRHPNTDAGAFAALVERIAETGAKIAAMPMGNHKLAQWQPFAEAAARHKDILFVISAGNVGADIDKNPTYPAALPNENFLVVTSANAFGQLTDGANFGAGHVDIAVPADPVEVMDHLGVKRRASGTSFAVPRVAALAARLLAAHPDWTAPELKQAIIALAAPFPRGRQGLTGYGWIPNPAAPLPPNL